MFAQQAAFTVHGSDTRLLYEILSDQVLQPFELSGNMHLETKEFFNFSNINAATVFADIVGLAGYLRKRLGSTSRRNWIGSHGEFKANAARPECRPKRTQEPVVKELLPQVIVSVITKRVDIDTFSLDTGEKLDSLAFLTATVRRRASSASRMPTR